MSRKDDALAVRDAALVVMRAKGRGRLIPKMGTYLCWDGNGLQMQFRTPFQTLRPIDGRMQLKAALSGLVLVPNLPYGLDIWEDGIGKVYNVEWNDQGDHHIASFRRGLWESVISDLLTNLLIVDKSSLGRFA